MSEQDPSTFDTREFRDAMGAFATGVTVITMAKPDGTLKAMTANAFSSVSLTPPMVLVCVDKNGSMHDWLGEVDAFGVNILTDTQQEISNTFAKSGENSEPMSGVEYKIGPLGVPVIENVILWTAARIVHKYDAGDHTIMVGQVEALRTNNTTNGPLLFHKGKYQQIGDQL